MLLAGLVRVALSSSIGWRGVVYWRRQGRVVRVDRAGAKGNAEGKGEN